MTQEPTKQKRKKSWYKTWWAITLMVIVGLMVFAVLYSAITGIPIVSIETEYNSSLDDEFETENISNEQTEIEQSPVKKPILETIKTCENRECYNLNLETCTITNFTISADESKYYTGKLTREIKGITNDNCVVAVNYKYITEILDREVINEGETICNIPLRNGKYYLFDYEVPIYCNNKTILKEEVAEPEQICVSLKQFAITKYKATYPSTSDIEYEVKYKSDYKQPNPIINNFEIKGTSYSSYSDSVYCHKGKNAGENINCWYCGNFLLSRNILDSDGTILHTQNIYAKSVFDSQLNYVKTICEDNYLMQNWELEIE